MSISTQWVTTFDEEIARLVDETGVPPEQWKTAGRKTQKQPAGEDIAWWKGEGLAQVVAYESWLGQSNLRIATMPDGKPAVEWGATLRLHPDSVPIQMHVDLIVEAGGGKHWIIDHKTGSRIPESPHQLALYAALLRENQAMTVDIGSFFMTRKAMLTDPQLLTPWGRDYWDDITSQVRDAIEGSIFVPKIGYHCQGCGVRQFCAAVDGVNKREDPVTWDFPERYDLPPHLSWSQISSWLWCGKQYELTRLRDLQETPAVWLAAGVAVHRVIEEINLQRWEQQQ